MSWLWVFLGGGLGACMRFGLGYLLPRTSDGFPLATLSANVLGCFAIGFLMPLISKEPARAFWLVGLLGGFTTFSAFSFEALELLQSRLILALAYVLASVGCGLLACWAGMRFHA